MTDQIERLTQALADRYSIERKLGEGGMATVYLAEDLKHQRKVAVKVLRPELAAAIGADRFLREITTTANLRHPHILPLYDSGEAEDFLFYVMPFVEGESLRDRLDRDKQLSVGDALKIAGEVGDALSYAHRHDVVHRDIKPENILLEEGHAVVADFGIAKAVDAGGGAQLTGTGMSVGTPVYMSPEQAGGEREIDGRSDLYSLACVLYEMLAGQPPFSGPTVQSVVHQHLAVDPQPVTNLRSSVAVEISDLIHQALSKNPADRFHSVSDFVSSLAATMSTTTQHPFPSNVPSRPRVLTMVGGTVIALVAVAGLLTVNRNAQPADSPRNDRSVAIMPFENIFPDADDAYFAAGMAEEIETQLSRLSGLRVVGRAATTRALESRNSSADVANALSVGALLEGTVRKAGDQVRITARLVNTADNANLWSQDFDRELSDVFAIQSEVARSVVSALQAELTAADEELLTELPTKNVAAYNLYLRASELQGRQPDENRAAIELLWQAVALDSSFVNAWASLGWRYTWKARIGDSTAIDSAFALARRALGLDSTSARARYALASAYVRVGRLTDAISQYRRALAYDPAYQGALRDGSAMLALTGQLAQSLDMAVRDLRQNPNIPNTRIHIGMPLVLLGDDDRADGWLEAAEAEGMVFQRLDQLRIMQDIYGGRRSEALERVTAGLQEYPGNYEFESAALATWVFLGETESALAGLERRNRLAPTGSIGWFWDVTHRTLLAFALYRSGESQRAADLFAESLRRSYSAYEGGTEATSTLMEIARIHATRSNAPEALEWLERAYQRGYRSYRELRLDPMLENLRGQEQFQELVSRTEADVAREREQAEDGRGVSVVDSVIAAAGIAQRERP